MIAYTTISNLLVAVGAKPFATTIQALRDNLLSAMEGDATAVAAGVTLKDPALDTGAATAAGTTWVALRTAGLSVGVVGSYAFFSTGVQNLGAGNTLAGSTLRYSNAGGSTGATPSGTWRLMGQLFNTNAETSTSLYLRIS